jgi:endonuclease IV
MKFGAHMPSARGAWRALERGISIGCDVVQLFVKNNMQWFSRPHEFAPTPSGLRALNFA